MKERRHEALPAEFTAFDRLVYPVAVRLLRLLIRDPRERALELENIVFRTQLLRVRREAKWAGREERLGFRQR